MGPRATKRQAKFEIRQASILTAASKVIAREGFEGASMRAMATQSRVGLSGIYYYYKNKDELLFAIQYSAFSSLVESLKERLAKLESAEQKLRAVIENHFQFFVENTDQFKVCVHEIDSLRGRFYKDVLAIRQEYFRLVRDVIGQIHHRSRYEVDMATFFLFGSLNWVYMWYDPAKNSDIRRVTGQFLKVILKGINGSQA